MNDNSQWVRPAGSSSDPDWDVRVLPGDPGWAHTGLLVATLAPGESREISTHGWEVIVVPLSGGVRVEASDAAGIEHQVDLAGRASVFAGATDVAYVPRESTLRVIGTAGVDANSSGQPTSKVALALAVASKSPQAKPFRHVSRQDVPVELRGAGIASREVRNFGVPAVLDADAIIACEVITPAGNWSSYPPHKHDEDRPGIETNLEEIYYFLTQPEGSAPEEAAAFGYQRVYGADDREIDVLAEVRNDDVVLVPHGWHGPAMAPPGYHLYYLNVMAGPGPERAWLICDDPAHAWVRQTWPDQQIDPRLPLRG